MARIAGVDIPREKRVVISLTYLFGIGPTTSKQVLAACEIDESIRVRDLGDQDVAKGIAVASRSVASAPTPTLGPARDQRRPLRVRKR